jgi:choline dehydrogenase-like flavoprotein
LDLLAQADGRAVRVVSLCGALVPLAMSLLLLSRYDVLVVGARCAGAATAMLMARSGLRVLVIDRGRYASDTTSTHALMRGGVMQLHRWGLLPRIVAAGTPAVRSTEFHYGEDVVQVEIRPQGTRCAAPHIAGQHSGGCRAGGRGGSPARLHAGRIAPPY